MLFRRSFFLGCVLICVVVSLHVFGGANNKADETTGQNTTQSINAPVKQEQSTTQPEIKTIYPANTLSHLSVSFAQSKDKQVTVTGKFGGWSHACTSSHMVTRSDWVLFDGDACLFVTGSKPGGVVMTSPKGEGIYVEGTLKSTSEGKYYLEATVASTDRH